MAKKIIKAQMKQRLDTKANWASENPVLLAGELGIVSDDPNLYKIGDGATAWNVLPFRGFDGTLVHTTGDSTTAAMSQKGTTQALDVLINGGMTQLTIQDFADKGKFLYGSSILESAQYNITDYIDIEGATKIEMQNLWGSTTGMHAFAIYNSEKILIGNNPTPAETGLLSYTLTQDNLPEGAAFLRATQNTLHPSLIHILKTEKGISARVEELERQVGLAAPENPALSTQTGPVKNLITDFTSYVGKHLNTNDGTLLASNAFTSSEFIKVSPGTTYSGGQLDTQFGGYKEVTLQEVCFYSKDKSYISAVTSVSEFRTPENAEFLRFAVLSKASSLENNGIDDIAVCEIVEGPSPISVFSKSHFTEAVGWTRLYLKKWLLIGDSNTEHNARAAAKYDEFIASETGVIPYNIGKSGAGYRIYKNEPFVFINILNNFATNNPDFTPDFITIMGGSNDVVFDWENVGTKDDTTDDTIFGCAHLLVERIKELYPTVPFAILTPFPHDYEDTEDNLRLDSFVKNLLEFCRDKNIPCLDLYHNSGIRPEEPAYNKKYFACAASPDGDGLHLNYYGQQLIASRIREFLLAYYG